MRGRRSLCFVTFFFLQNYPLFRVPLPTSFACRPLSGQAFSSPYHPASTRARGGLRRRCLNRPNELFMRNFSPPRDLAHRWASALRHVLLSPARRRCAFANVFHEMLLKQSAEVFPRGKKRDAKGSMLMLNLAGEEGRQKIAEAQVLLRLCDRLINLSRAFILKINFYLFKCISPAI